jgi:hypothetical protein
MAVQNRKEQRLHPVSPGDGLRRVRRAAGIDERNDVARAYHPQPQRPVGHRTALLHRDRQEAPLLQVVREGLS